MPYNISVSQMLSSLNISNQKNLRAGAPGISHSREIKHRRDLERDAKALVSGWIGVDLDGTLAYYDGWKGPAHIGHPVPLMAERVRAWLAQGREVRIFTARASRPEYVRYVEDWCKAHFGMRLAVTNTKDFGMLELWDDRCVQVQPNTGQVVSKLWKH